MTDMAREYAARAATFRRLANELSNEKDRVALLAIAEQYAAVGERLSEEEAAPGDEPEAGKA
jgi:hypothetical protein